MSNPTHPTIRWDPIERTYLIGGEPHQVDAAVRALLASGHTYSEVLDLLHGAVAAASAGVAR